MTGKDRNPKITMENLAIIVIVILSFIYAILIVNLLFGWTVLGWLATIIRAVVKQPEEPPRRLTAEPRRMTFEQWRANRAAKK